MIGGAREKARRHAGARRGAVRGRRVGGLRRQRRILPGGESVRFRVRSAYRECPCEYLCGCRRCVAR